MNKKIFCINGSAMVGKDTFCSMIGSIIPSKIYSSVQCIKDAAKLLGWNGVKDERSRKFLSDLKMLSSEFNDFPYCMLKKTIDDFYEDDIHEFLFLHVREAVEIKRLIAEYPEIITVLVTNPNVAQVVSNEADADVYNFYGYDEIISNDEDLMMLKMKANKFIEKYTGKKIEIM